MRNEHKTLCERAATHDPVALESLVDHHLPGLQAFIRLRLGPEFRARESASDLTQSVCREVLEQVDGFEYRGEAAFTAWLYTLALSKIRDRYRLHTAGRRDVRREHDGRDFSQFYARLGTPSQHAIQQEQIARIESAFDKLTETHREVVTLAKIVGLSHKEIAERLGKSELACRKLLQRALLALSWELSRDGP